METGKANVVEGYELRPELRWFAEEMERVLRANDHKQGISTEKCYRRLIDEALELNTALGKVNLFKPELTPQVLRDKAIKEAVDVGNFAFFIAKNIRRTNEQD